MSEGGRVRGGDRGGVGFRGGGSTSRTRGEGMGHLKKRCRSATSISALEKFAEQNEKDFKKKGTSGARFHESWLRQTGVKTNWLVSAHMGE